MKRRLLVIVFTIIGVLTVLQGNDQKKAVDDFYFDRLEMVRGQIAARGIKDSSVLNAMKKVPRHELVPIESRDKAYEDHPLPIGHGQTISQPYIVALMTELLDLEPDDRVLEVGTGSGYQAAVLGEIVKEVITCEIIGSLAIRAKDDLIRLGYQNVKVHHSDGYWGYKKGAPYDAIIVTAAPGYIPPPLLQQLKPGGSMVIPVGKSGRTQSLILVKKDMDGNSTTEDIMPVRFVPFTRD